jgi:flagellar biosynthesis/type III secretory pathway protein FliH
MTSSFRATGHASVRATPTSSATAPGAWALTELKMPVTPASAKDAGLAAPPVSAALVAEERARAIDEGYARGLADGEQKGKAAAQAQVSEAIGVLNDAVAQLHELATLAPPILEENIAALAVVVARQIVAREVGLDSTLVADLVRRALTEFPIDQAVRIRVNPLDLSLLTLNGIAKESAPITGARDASWLADPRLARGGCLVEGRDRIIDGRVDTALERAYQRMAQVDAS